MRRILLLSAFVLGWGGCVVHADADGDCGEESYDCYVEYSPGYGYSRVCEVVLVPAICIEVDDDEPSPPRYARRSTPGVTSAGASGSVSGGVGVSGNGSGSEGESSPPASDPSESEGFDFPCERDAQCGTGLCIEGDCFYGCEGDADCGTADRCVMLDAIPVCRADDEPAVNCTRSAECGYEQICLNAACHDSCGVTSDCSNELDRCVAGVCVPDRRVVSECLLDRECAEGKVCIDALCQEL